MKARTPILVLSLILTLITPSLRAADRQDALEALEARKAAIGHEAAEIAPLHANALKNLGTAKAKATTSTVLGALGGVLPASIAGLVLGTLYGHHVKKLGDTGPLFYGMAVGAPIAVLAEIIALPTLTSWSFRSSESRFQDRTVNVTANLPRVTSSLDADQALQALEAFRVAQETLSSVADEIAAAKSTHFYSLGWDKARVFRVEAAFLMAKANLLKIELDFVDAALAAL